MLRVNFYVVGLRACSPIAIGNENERKLRVCLLIRNMNLILNLLLSNLLKTIENQVMWTPYTNRELNSYWKKEYNSLHPPKELSSIYNGV